jgi:hypothetical protein
VGKAIIDQLALGILPGHDQGGQVIEQHRQIHLVVQQGLLLDIAPDGRKVLGQGIQGTAQPVIVELVLGNAQVLRNQGGGQPVDHLVQWTRRHQPVQDQHQRHSAMIHRTAGRTVPVDDLADLQPVQQRNQHWQRPQVAHDALAGEELDDFGQIAAGP